MSKKRAFVRYSKQGKIVPGSLILTAGSFPNGSSTWKEVPADLCCDNSEDCTNSYSTSFTLQGTESAIVFVSELFLKCNNSTTGVVFSGWGVPAGGDTTIQEFIETLNNTISPNLATFTWGGGTTVNAQISSCLKSAICSDGELSIDFARIPD